MEVFITILAVAFTLVEILGILAAVHAVMYTRTSQGAVAWAIALITLPFVTLVPYAIFGRNKFNGYVDMRSRRDARLHNLCRQLQTKARDNDLIRAPASEADRALVFLYPTRIVHDRDDDPSNPTGGTIRHFETLLDIFFRIFGRKLFDLGAPFQKVPEFRLLE